YEVTGDVSVRIWRTALRRWADVGSDSAAGYLYRLAGVDCSIDPLVSRAGIRAAIGQIPGIDVVEADLEVVVTPFVVEARTVIHHRFTMRRIREKRLALRVGNAIVVGRKKPRVLIGTACNVR